MATIRKTMKTAEVKRKVYYWLRFYFGEFRECQKKGYESQSRDNRNKLAGVLVLAVSLGIFTDEQFSRINDRIWYM